MPPLVPTEAEGCACSVEDAVAAAWARTGSTINSLIPYTTGADNKESSRLFVEPIDDVPNGAWAVVQGLGVPTSRRVGNKRIGGNVIRVTIFGTNKKQVLDLAETAHDDLNGVCLNVCSGEICNIQRTTGPPVARRIKHGEWFVEMRYVGGWFN